MSILSQKMVEYFRVCSACNDIIHEDVIESCKKCYCNYCTSCFKEYGRFVKPKCRGDSCEALISVGNYHDTSARTSSCNCTDGIQAIRKRLTKTSFVCYTCLSVECPDNMVLDSQVIDFLLGRSSIYKLVDQVKEIIFYRQKTPYAEIKFLLLLKTRPTIFNNLPTELRRVLFEFLF